MVHAYHLVLPHYGFWLPNDPRGSWSDFVASWEIARFGQTTRHLEQRTLAMLSTEERAIRDAARRALRYPPVTLTGIQALSVANGFKEQSIKSDYAVWACSILPEHTHLVVSRHRYQVEQIANLLKGAATRRLLADSNHPQAPYAKPDRRPPGMWARHHWKSFLDSDQAIENAINYVLENPTKEGKPRQNWKWLTPYTGLSPGWTTYQ
ncbi:MAG: transposase [Pirellula sp.]|jgi:REP element-mobilizing transposase RayT|nr:transposase [Pirellula sp.]